MNTTLVVRQLRVMKKTPLFLSTLMLLSACVLEVVVLGHDETGDTSLGDDASGTNDDLGSDDGPGSDDGAGTDDDSGTDDGVGTEETEGDSDTEESGTGSSPEATTLSLNFSPTKQFEFGWPPAEGAEYYQLLERESDGQDYVQVGPDLMDDSVTLTVPLHLRVNASYIVRSCNEWGCTDSEPTAVTGTMAEAIGYIKASNPDPGDQFGYAVALSADGNTLAVGATLEDSSAAGQQSDNSLSNAGCVYIFVRTGNGWSQQGFIKASNAGSNDKFGVDIALSADGNTLAVGADAEDSPSTGINGEDGNNGFYAESGAVYVFIRQDAEWSQQAYIKASNTGLSDRFGHQVSLSGDGNTLAVSAYQEDSASGGLNGDQGNDDAQNSGAVYIYSRFGAEWAQEAYVKAADPGASSELGRVLDLSADGNVLAASAASDNGVYVFQRIEGAWTQQSYLKASNSEEWDFFGLSLALSADASTLVVGAWQEDSAAVGVGGDQLDNSASNSGAAYVFTQNGGGWSQQAYIKASNTSSLDVFSSDVAISGTGDVIAVGAYVENGGAIGLGGNQADDSAENAGAVYVFKREGEVWEQQAYVKASNTGSLDLFGCSLELSDDANTLVVGAYGESSGSWNDPLSDAAPKAGAVYLF